jgi:hypothetical protein
VLVDAPAWPAGPDATDLADGCDAIYLVQRRADATAPAVRDDILARTGRLRGCVLTE